MSCDVQRMRRLIDSVRRLTNRFQRIHITLLLPISPLFILFSTSNLLSYNCPSLNLSPSNNLDIIHNVFADDDPSDGESTSSLILSGHSNPSPYLSFPRGGGDRRGRKHQEYDFRLVGLSLVLDSRWFRPSLAHLEVFFLTRIVDDCKGNEISD